MWSHKSYKAVWPVRFVLMLLGSGAVQGSIRWWARNHRIHHRYTDTALDPYNARQGFFYSHFGWMLITKDYSKITMKTKFDVADLEADSMVMWQNRTYGVVALGMSFVFPTLVAGLGWGDWKGGFFFAGVARLVFVHHATFCVNSLAHWFGNQPFADDHTPKDHVLTAFVTLGEGYHNFHHEFPQDYRNALKWYQYDPTKWIINTLWWSGLVYDLKEFGSNEIKMGQYQMEKKKLDATKSQVGWGEDTDNKLPTMDKFQFQQRVDNGEKLIIVDKYIHKVDDWVDEHPGGKIICEYLGKDASKEFRGGVHNHSMTAGRLLNKLRIATFEETRVFQRKI